MSATVEEEAVDAQSDQVDQQNEEHNCDRGEVHLDRRLENGKEPSYRLDRDHGLCTSYF